MKIAVIGAGGVGGYFGGLLARSGAPVSFMARGAQLEALQTLGLTVKSVDEEFTVNPVHAVGAAAGLEAPDIILLTVKTYDTESVCRELAPVLRPSSILIPLQNGIDNDRRIQELLPDVKVYPGLTYIISTRTAPGTIEQTAGPRTIFFGDRNPGENPRLQELEAVMRSAGIRATCAPNIETELWNKFLWIAAFAGMTSLCRAPIGRIVNDAEGYELFLRCYDEGLAVAAALGIELGDEPRKEAVRKINDYRLSGGHAKASMLVDIENGRMTEIESLNGAIVRLAKNVRVSVPIHETIYHSVRLASAEYLGAGGPVAR